MKKVLVGMPNMGTIPSKTVASYMGLWKAMGFPETIFLENSLIYDARNDICREAINGDFDEVLFIDSDLVFPADAYEKLEALDADIATGIYYGRAGEHKPTVYYEVLPKRENTIISTKEESKVEILPAVAKAFETIPEGTFSIKGCGMGMCLIKRIVLEALCDATDNSPFEPWKGLGEDLAFCYRAKQSGFTIKANSYIPLGHIGTQVFTKGDYKA